MPCQRQALNVMHKLFANNNMRNIWTLIIILLGTLQDSGAQKRIPATDSIQIVGEILNPKCIHLNEIENIKSTKIKDFILLDHKGEVKDSLFGIYGIPFKTFLEGIEFRYSKPKELNEFIFVLTASDGYKVVLSWNEIYNTEIGDHFYIVTEINGKRNIDNENRIIFLSSVDLKNGRRFIKGLKKIEVRHIE